MAIRSTAVGGDGPGPERHSRPRSHNAWPFLVGLALLSASVPGAARAAGSTGIKIAEGRLHPFADLETQHVYNPGRVTRARGSAPNDLLLIARPGLEFALPSPTLDLKFDGAVERRQFVGLQTPGTRRLSTFAGNAGLNMLVNKEGKFVFRLYDDYRRIAGPGNQTVTQRLLSHVNTAGLGFDYKPGGGALVFSLDYSFFLNVFDRQRTGLASPRALDNLRHQPRLRATWKFLPKTATFIEANGQITRFFNAGQGAFRTANANLLTTYLGIVGALTPKLNVLAKAGYGNTFIAEANSDNFNSVVGQAEVNWKPTTTTGLRGGFLREVQPTALFGFFDRLGGYLQFDQALGGSTNMNLRLEYNVFNYGAAPAVNAPNLPEFPNIDRADQSVRANLGLAHQFTQWFDLNIQNRFEWRDSNFVNPANNRPFSFLQNRFLVRARFKY